MSASTSHVQPLYDTTEKDIVLSELQDLSVEDVKQAESREALRQRLISAISQIFPTKPEWADPEPIKKVLFEEFVLQ